MENEDSSKKSKDNNFDQRPRRIEEETPGRGQKLVGSHLPVGNRKWDEEQESSEEYDDIGLPASEGQIEKIEKMITSEQIFLKEQVDKNPRRYPKEFYSAVTRLLNKIKDSIDDPSSNGLALLQQLTPVIHEDMPAKSRFKKLAKIQTDERFAAFFGFHVIRTKEELKEQYGYSEKELASHLEQIQELYPA